MRAIGYTGALVAAGSFVGSRCQARQTNSTEVAVGNWQKEFTHTNPVTGAAYNVLLQDRGELSDAEVRRICEGLSRLPARFAEVFPWSAALTFCPLTSPSVTVVVLKDAAGYAQYCAETGHHSNNSRAHYLPTSRRIACYQDIQQEHLRIIVHEATHALVDSKAQFAAMRKQLWLSEGLSEYFAYDGARPYAKHLAVVRASWALAKVGTNTGSEGMWAGGMMPIKDLLAYRANTKASKKKPPTLSATEQGAVDSVSAWLRDSAGVEVCRDHEEGSEGKLQRIRLKAIYAQVQY
jgi:hypothetical protein